MSAVAITAAMVAETTNGRLVAGPAQTPFSAVSIDSRTIAAGSLFVAIRGDRFDGHDYVAKAVERGATGVLVSRPVSAGDGVAVVEVADTLVALQRIARAVRVRSGAKVVAITGSAGKTSTKEITADLLATRYRVFRNRGNLNNHIGLPLSLTELMHGPDVAIVELGMNHAGEIRELVRIAEPDVRVWTNVGDAHIGYFGSREAVASAKAEILEGADADSVLVANADDPLVAKHARAFTGRLITFGAAASATVRAVEVSDRGFEGGTAVVHTPAGILNLALRLPGRAHLMNVLAGVSVATELGVELRTIERVVDAARPVPRRGSMTVLPSGTRIVDDTYNASPAAVQTMLQTLAATPGATRRVAVLGEMRELGDSALALHEACGRTAGGAGIDVLIAVGGAAADGLVAGASASGIPPDRIHRFSDSASATAPVAALLRSGDLVLVKGSRGTRMDVIADALVASERQG